MFSTIFCTKCTGLISGNQLCPGQTLDCLLWTIPTSRVFRILTASSLVSQGPVYQHNMRMQMMIVYNLEESGIAAEFYVLHIFLRET
jgi:hypothetical protein